MLGCGMFQNLRVAVVIPAYREAARIREVITTLPPWVDHVIVVDDASPDATHKAASAVGDPRLVVLRHEANQGVGGATVTGFRKALELKADLIVKMDGDGQMDPAHLPSLLTPLVEGRAEYSKGNRFRSASMLRGMPVIRLLGNAALTFLVKVASGYWHVADPQNGYLAIHSASLRQLDLDAMDRRYFFEDDMLIHLNVIEARIQDVSMPSVYRGTHSSLRPFRILLTHPPRLLRGLVRRIWYRYILYDFSPVALLLAAGLPLTAFGFLWGLVHWIRAIQTGIQTPLGTVMLAVLPLMLGVQSLLSALHLDIQNSPRPQSPIGATTRPPPHDG